MEIKSQTIGNFTYDWFSSFYVFVNKFVPLYIYNASLTDSEFDESKFKYKEYYKSIRTFFNSLDI